jgi:threonyl-tRNA synthetase
MDRLMEVGIRAELDDRAEKIGYKIREANGKYKVPVQLIIGKSEAEAKEVNVRRFGSKDQETMGLEEFISNIVEEAKIKFDQ